MIAEEYLKLLEKESKILKKNKEIFDILLYGSGAKGKRKINDVDIIFIFKNQSLEKRLEITQKFKKKVSKIKNLDIKSINLIELFDKTFLARQGILVEGISLINKKPFSKRMGFEGFGLFTYGIKNLTNTQKVKLTFALNGRRGEEGMLKKLNAKTLSKT